MADSLTDVFQGAIQVKMNYTRLDTQEVGYAQNKKNSTSLYSIDDGTGDNQAETVYANKRTIAANSVDAVDLQNLTQNALEVSLDFAFSKVRVFRCVNLSETSGEYLYFGASADDPNVFAVAVGPESEALIINQKDGYDVGSSNNVLRTYNPNSVPVSYELYIIGSPA